MKFTRATSDGKEAAGHAINLMCIAYAAAGRIMFYIEHGHAFAIDAKHC